MLPNWWLIISGICYVLIILFVLLLIAAVLFALKALQGVTPKLETLMNHVNKMAEHGEHIASNVDKITKEVREPAANVAHRIDDVSSTFSNIIQKGSLTFLGVAAITKLIGFLKRR